MQLPCRDNPLEAKLKSIIQIDGPLSVSTFMTVCLHDPEHGYYATNPKIGQDFCTSPEISQIFGELIGLWLVQEWYTMDRPNPFILAELGPGRGTMMSDALRATRKYSDYMEAVQLFLVESSLSLRKVQNDTLAEYSPRFVESLDELPSGPLLCVGNEFLDCLPVRQFVHKNGCCFERLVGLDDKGELAFGVSAEKSDVQLVDFGGIIEIQEGLTTVIEILSEREDSFRTLFIDYGTMLQEPRDSLRSFSKGFQIDPFSDVGRSDLTVDIDFARFVRLARGFGMGVFGPVTQREFLLKLGIETRLEILCQNNTKKARILEGDVFKLIDPSEMGEKFKVVCLCDNGQSAPVGF